MNINSLIYYNLEAFWVGLSIMKIIMMLPIHKERISYSKGKTIMKKIILILGIAVSILIIVTVILNNRVRKEDMPDIVFMRVIGYGDFPREEGVKEEYYFYDRDGNYYYSKDKYLYPLSYEEIVNEYIAGNLNDKIELKSSCNTDELLSNYKKILSLRNKKVEIVYPRTLPCVESADHTWYAIYYDKNNNLKTLEIHSMIRLTSLSTDNDVANEVYQWWEDSLKE